MYHPLELSKKTEELVLNNIMKKYYRFRPTRFYGGIATADVVGCNLRCKFCWSGNSVWNAAHTGILYSPEQVAEELHRIAQHKGYTQVRISGGEPTIGRAHLIAVLKHIKPELLFILETNGILLGADETYVKELSRFKNLHVRICFKGINPEEFSWLTGAKNGFEYQLKALEYLRDTKVVFNIAVVSTKKDRCEFFKQLTALGLSTIMVEEEEVTLYPQVRERLKKENLIHYFEDTMNRSS
jgi:uncharacterized Fe-S cluster-containing radical SAM superfamily protein